MNWSLGPSAEARTLRAFGIAACAIAMLLQACRDRADETQDTTASADVRDSSRGSSGTPAAADSLERLVTRLRSLPGQFVTNGQGMAEFSGDRGVFTTISRFGDAAVARLVGCLDDATPTAATNGGRPVPLGVMCNEALRFTASYEATDASGDLDETWPGYVGPSATIADLRRAKEAWQSVVSKRSYALVSDS